MTIKKRLAVSNVLMIVVPVLITAVVAVCCIAIIWFAIARGTGLGFEDSEDFYSASSGITEVVTEGIQHDEKEKQLKELDKITSFLDNGAMSLVVTADGKSFYQYGTAGTSQEDKQLVEAASLLDNEGVLTSGTRNMRAHAVEYNGVDYVIYLYNTQQELSYDTLELAILIAGLILLAVILASIFWANRFFTNFVFRHIEGSLDKLVEGVTQISRGNLDYRMESSVADEFAPVFADFNDMADRLKASVERSRREEESRKELMASVSHDLRTPLTSIHAYVEGLLDGVAKTPKAKRKYLETIKKRAEELEGMVERILEYSRLEMDAPDVHIADIRLDEYLEEKISSLSPDYSDRGLDITCELAPVVVSADASELHSVFTNIADNSLKYKAAERASLHIALVDEGDTCKLSFTDDGPGVPEDSLEKLFDAFYRTDWSRNETDQGNGLGLAIVRKIIRNMSGTVKAENSDRGGLSIIMELPKGGAVDGEDTDH